jgi:FkbM family methyltransferase
MFTTSGDIDMRLPRTLLERFSRGWVLKRRLPAIFGNVPIMVSPDASLRFWKPGVDSDLFDFAREFVRPGNVVWDVGANLGLFTLSAAQRAGASGRVVAVEADMWLVGLLRKSASIQPRTSACIQVIPAAISNALAIAQFNIAQRGRASNFLSGAEGSTQTGGVRETVSVVTVTLDWLLEQGVAPNVLKIDVEGAELSVLEGARRVLAEAHPVILCEVRERSSDAISAILLQYGYTLFDWDTKPRVQVDRATYNTLAISAT